MRLRHRILGIDSSLTSSGMCRIDIGNEDLPPVIETWTIQSKPGRNRTPVGMSQRITEIVTAMEPHIARADLVSLEGVSFASSGAAAHALHWLWGRIVDTTVGNAVELLIVTPSQRMKYATGKGNAQKDAVLAAAVRRWPNVDVVGNDIADALIMGAIGCRYLGYPIDDMPKAHWEPVMAKIGA